MRPAHHPLFANCKGVKSINAKNTRNTLILYLIQSLETYWSCDYYISSPSHSPRVTLFTANTYLSPRSTLHILMRVCLFFNNVGSLHPSAHVLPLRLQTSTLLTIKSVRGEPGDEDKGKHCAGPGSKTVANSVSSSKAIMHLHIKWEHGATDSTCINVTTSSAI